MYDSDGYNENNEYSKWKFSFRDGVWGHVTAPITSRWITWDAPWTEDVRPQRLFYFGKKWCWILGAKSQKYDWKNNRFASLDKKNWKRFVLYPTNYRERVK